VCVLCECVFCVSVCLSEIRSTNEEIILALFASPGSQSRKQKHLRECLCVCKYVFACVSVCVCLCVFVYVEH